MKLLEMIENVDPDDTDTLDEIDARVWYFKEGKVYDEDSVAHFPHYTRSRDALKTIRPEGCSITLNIHPANISYQFWVKHTETEPRPYPFENENPLPTEELAELHAILQAIQHERETDETIKSV